MSTQVAFFHPVQILRSRRSLNDLTVIVLMFEDFKSL